MALELFSVIESTAFQHENIFEFFCICIAFAFAFVSVLLARAAKFKCSSRGWFDLL